MTLNARPLVLFLLAGSLGLAACATDGSPAKPAAGVATPAPAPIRGYGEMAPIPNPTAEQAEKAAAAARPQPARLPRPPVAAASARLPAKPAPAAASPTANAQRAAQLRGQGLEQLNRGAIDRAIVLLQQAQALDVGNLLIQRDLERAVRIGRAVRAKP